MSVRGNVAPVIENPVPVKVAELTVTAAVPEDVNVSVFVEVVLSVSLPNASVVALRASCGEVPVPLRATVLVLPLKELLEMVIVPLAAPATVGSKVT